ncbi:hypothetical protein ACLKA7_009295 [Drosophila subpalustris]
MATNTNYNYNSNNNSHNNNKKVCHANKLGRDRLLFHLHLENEGCKRSYSDADFEPHVSTVARRAVRSWPLESLCLMSRKWPQDTNMDTDKLPAASWSHNKDTRAS